MMKQAVFFIILLFTLVFTSTYASDSTDVPVPDFLQKEGAKQILAGGITNKIGPSGGVGSQTITINGSCAGQPQGRPQYLLSIYQTDEPGNTTMFCNMRTIKAVGFLNPVSSGYDSALRVYTKWTLQIMGEIQTSKNVANCNNQPFVASYLVFCP